MAINDITGDAIRSKSVVNSYMENFDRIFGVSNANDQSADSANGSGDEGAGRQADQIDHKENGAPG